MLRFLGTQEQWVCTEWILEASPGVLFQAIFRTPLERKRAVSQYQRGEPLDPFPLTTAILTSSHTFPDDIPEPRFTLLLCALLRAYSMIFSGLRDQL